MTALTTRSQIECNKCAAPLTGGPDTFGDWPQAFCFTCYHDTLAETATAPRKEFLEKLRDKLENEAGDIENELNGHGRCKEEEPKPK